CGAGVWVGVGDVGHSRVLTRQAAVAEAEIWRLILGLFELPIVAWLPLARRIRELGMLGAPVLGFSRQVRVLQLKTYAIVVGTTALVVWLNIVTRLVFVFLLLAVLGIV